MSEKNENGIVAIVKDAPLWHNGTYYDIGAEITLSEAEYTQLSVYLMPKDEALKAQQQSVREAEAQAAALREQAENEKVQLQQALADAQQAHIQAEALATENGLRAEQAEAKVAELQALLGEKTSEIATLTAELTACKKAKSKKGDKTDSHASESTKATGE